MQPYNPIFWDLDCSSGTLYGFAVVYSMIVAGDGYAYVGYAYLELNVDCFGAGSTLKSHLKLLRISSSGAYHIIPIADVQAQGEDATTFFRRVKMSGSA